MRSALGIRRNKTTGLILLFLPLLSLSLSAHAEPLNTPQPQPSRPLDPMNRPMDELGVTGHDTTLCSDRWSMCSSYDRQQFDKKYPGQRLNELLLHGEPDWPDKQRDGREWQEKRDRGDSLDHHDRLDKD